MAANERKILRCAVYTRKSSEHGLEQDFNSLDAQREAAEAYIKSQAHEGWRCIKTPRPNPVNLNHDRRLATGERACRCAGLGRMRATQSFPKIGFGRNRLASGAFDDSRIPPRSNHHRLRRLRPLARHGRADERSKDSSALTLLRGTADRPLHGRVHLLLGWHSRSHSRFVGVGRLGWRWLRSGRSQIWHLEGRRAHQYQAA
jgi:hypothetical protein